MANSYRVKILAGFIVALSVLGLILATWSVAAHHTASKFSHTTSPSRIMRRQLVVDNNVTLSAEARDDEMLFSDSPDLAAANINPSELKAMGGEFCHNHRGCDMAFICVDHKCIKGCTKNIDCAIGQTCTKGKCMFTEHECSTYKTACFSNSECCSGYCGGTDNIFKSWPVCRRFYFPKPPQVPEEPEDPNDPRQPQDPTKPKQPKRPKKPKKPKKPKGKNPPKPGLNQTDEIEHNEVKDIVEDVDETED